MKPIVWINRALITTFFIVGVLGIFIKEYLFYGLFILFVIGVFQVITFFILISSSVNSLKSVKKKLGMYNRMVIGFFIFLAIGWGIIESEVLPSYQYRLIFENFLGYTALILAFTISLYFSFMVEKMNQIKIKGN